jgi:hypothetical protein
MYVIRGSMTVASSFARVHPTVRRTDGGRLAARGLVGSLFLLEGGGGGPWGSRFYPTPPFSVATYTTLVLLPCGYHGFIALVGHVTRKQSLCGDVPSPGSCPQDGQMSFFIQRFTSMFVLVLVSSCCCCCCPIGSAWFSHNLLCPLARGRTLSLPNRDDWKFDNGKNG